MLLLSGFYENRGNIVFPAVGIGGLNEFLGRFIEIVSLKTIALKDFEDPLVVGHGGQSIRANEKDIALFGIHFINFDADVKFITHGTGDDVLGAIRFSLFTRDDAGSNLLLNPRVVARDLPEVAGPEK